MPNTITPQVLRRKFEEYSGTIAAYSLRDAQILNVWLSTNFSNRRGTNATAEIDSRVQVTMHLLERLVREGRHRGLVQ